MSETLSGEFFAQLEVQLLEELRSSLATHRSSPDDSPVHGFVIYYHPLHGDVRWRVHTRETEQETDPQLFVEPPGHPDGPRFGLGYSSENDTVSGSTEDMLGTYSAAYAESGYADDGLESGFVRTLISCIKQLSDAFEELPTTPDFVAFIADVDGADVDMLKETVDAETLERVFPDM